jgi:hypothetical protein
MGFTRRFESENGGHADGTTQEARMVLQPMPRLRAWLGGASREAQEETLMVNAVLGVVGAVSSGVGVMVAFVSQVAPIGRLAQQILLFFGGALFGAGLIVSHFAGML